VLTLRQVMRGPGRENHRDPHLSPMSFRCFAFFDFFSFFTLRGGRAAAIIFTNSANPSAEAPPPRV
jgi:hypothetical protein